MAKVLVVATSRKTRGGITAVVKAHEEGEQWQRYHCRWIETHRDGSQWKKVAYFLRSFVCYLFLLPRYDLVHIHFSTQKSAIRKLPFMWWAVVWHKKTVSHLHTCDLETSLQSRFQWVYRYLLNHSDRIITLSDYWRKEVLYFCTTTQKVRRGHVVVVFNPCTAHVDRTEPTAGFSDSDAPLQRRHSILFAGTLIARKGYADLLRAFALIAPRHDDWQLLMAGNGEMEEGQRLARELGIERQTLWLGWVSGADKERAFREADVFCLPSYAEGFPMAVLDAMAYGLPVVTTPVGGIPDIAVDGENMLLFAPGNHQQLADRLERLMTDDGLREKLSQASLQLAATTFNVETIDKQIGELYEAVLSEPEAEITPPNHPVAQQF